MDLDISKVNPSMRSLVTENVDLFAATERYLKGEELSYVDVIDLRGAALWVIKAKLIESSYRERSLPELAMNLDDAIYGYFKPSEVVMWDGEALRAVDTLHKDVKALMRMFKLVRNVCEGRKHKTEYTLIKG